MGKAMKELKNAAFQEYVQRQVQGGIAEGLERAVLRAFGTIQGYGFFKRLTFCFMLLIKHVVKPHEEVKRGVKQRIRDAYDCCAGYMIWLGKTVTGQYRKS